MSQFIDTDHANEAYRNALKSYESDKLRINNIREKRKYADISLEEIEWLCSLAERGINAEESTWFDHG